MRLLSLLLCGLSLLYSCSSSTRYSDIKILHRDAVNPLENIKWHIVESGKTRALEDRAEVTLQEDAQAVFILDLSASTGANDLRLMRAIKAGAKAQIQLVSVKDDTVLFSLPVPSTYAEAYQQRTIVITQFDQFGEKVITDEIQREEKKPVNQKEYTDTDKIRFPVQITAQGSWKNTEVYLLLKVSQSTAAAAEQVIQGEPLVEELKKNPDSHVTIYAEPAASGDMQSRPLRLMLTATGRTPALAGTGETTPPGKDGGETIIPEDQSKPGPAADEGKSRFIAQTHRGTKVRNAHVLFGSGSSEIRPEMHKQFEAVLAVVREFPEYTVIIEGHTDMEGDRAKNLELSLQRAEQAMNYLVAKGVPAYRLKLRSYGPDIPFTNNVTPEGKTLNRRVEFYLEEPEGK